MNLTVIISTKGLCSSIITIYIALSICFNDCSIDRFCLIIALNHPEPQCNYIAKAWKEQKFHSQHSLANICTLFYVLGRIIYFYFHTWMNITINVDLSLNCKTTSSFAHMTLQIEIESEKTTSMENFSTGVLDEIRKTIQDVKIKPNNHMMY